VGVPTRALTAVTTAGCHLEGGRKENPPPIGRRVGNRDESTLDRRCLDSRHCSRGPLDGGALSHGRVHTPAKGAHGGAISSPPSAASGCHGGTRCSANEKRKEGGRERERGLVENRWHLLHRPRWAAGVASHRPWKNEQR
jgi:hypothetical protein